VTEFDIQSQRQKRETMMQGDMNAPPVAEATLQFSEREEQILAVATELLIKWGYKRVTMDDIAQYAGVGKGTLYLHWKSRDGLLQTILLREILDIWRNLMEQVRHDPYAIRYSRLMRTLMLNAMNRPLAKAIFTGNAEVLGKMAGSGNRTLKNQQLLSSNQFITLLREYGLLRTDDPIPHQIYAMQAAITGFFLLDPALLGEDRLTLEERADVLALTIERLFEPPTPPDDETMAEAGATMMEWMEGACNQYERIIRGFMT
jgi:AcrR family transcriptional regulator